ncbi:MAG: hypothetical protein WEB58_16925 [Planctomycetaceae bacterium]
MTDVLEYPESQFVDEFSCFIEHRGGKRRIPSAVDGKGLLRLGMQLSSGDSCQGNLNRAVLRESQTVANLPFHGCGHLTNRSQIGRQIDFDQVVEFIRLGGRPAVKSLLRAISPEARTNNRAMIDALGKLLGGAMDNVVMNDRGSFPALVESFLDRAERLDAQGQTEAALDLVYDSIDGSLKRGQFVEVDAILEQVQVTDYSTDILIGLLTATLPARSKLQARPQFFRDVEACLLSRHEYEEGLLTGLE